MKVRAAVLLALTLVLSGACGESPAGGGEATQAPPSPPAKEAPPTLLLVTVDTWRWDYLGASGSGRVETPILDAFARAGLYIPKAQTSCPLTTPAHATILTGLTPARHGVRDNLHFRLRADVPTLATVLSGAGYHTAAVVAGAPLRRVYGLDRGFDVYDDAGLLHEGDESLTPSSRPAPEVADRSLALAAGAPAGRPLFLWVHFYDPHHPYLPPEPFRSRYAADPYAGEVALVDREVGRLLAGLRASRAGDLNVAVVGDHGEGLGDHGEETHGIGLYESTLQVPLILWTGPVGTRVGGPAGLVDLFATLLGVASVPAPPSEGVDLRSGPRTDRWLTAESAFPTLAFGLNPNLALRRGHLIGFHHGVDEVYDLAEDPGQRRDIAGEERVRAFLKEARSVLPEAFGADPSRDMVQTSLTLSRQELGALQGLGYLGGGLPQGNTVTRADLRVFLKDFSRLNEARRFFTARRFGEAASLYREFLRRYGRSGLAWRELGACGVGLGDMALAKESFSKALALDPADAVAALNLGNLAALSGDSAGAEKLYRLSLAAEEAQPQAHLNLGILYAQVLGRKADAAPHLRRFLELAPDDPEAPQIQALLAAQP